MTFYSDTIAAIATAMSDSGIGIIRISGEEAISIANKIFRSVNPDKKLINVKSHTVHYGYIYDGDKFLDEVMVIVMKSPRSYTTEDTVEINCHGGVLMVNRILEAVLKYGARLAEPGEFTKRAFLNGRIDLSKAEALTPSVNIFTVSGGLLVNTATSSMSGFCAMAHSTPRPRFP